MTEYGVPYLAPFAWYRSWINGRLTGLTPGEAAEYAWRELHRKPREWSRATIADSLSGNKIKLTVPLEGGASVAKKGISVNPRISSHGDWQRLHVGALNAACSRTPYAPYFLPDIEKIIYSYPEKLVDLNFQLHTIVLRMLDIEGIIRFMNRSRSSIDNSVLYQNSKEISESIDPEISIVAPVCHYGPRLILSLLAFE